jgi:NADH:ubiquinone oxidoreductase subunit 5 (subunit L)/multisubunit Na+/H+ antiporter MnhA subunit
MVVGVVTILGAVFMAMIQHDLRRLLSFHAVSQVGYMLLGIGTGTVIGVMGGVFHMLNHAIYKSCLFLGAGAVEREAGTMELGKLGGLGKTMPLTFGSMLVAALAIAGIPPFNGFASKWLVYQGCVAGGQPIFLIAALFGSVLTLASFVKVLHSVFWGARPGRLDGVKEGGIALRVPMVTLAVFCIVLGVFAQFPLREFMGPVVGLEPEAAVTGAAALESAPETQSMVTGEPASSVTAQEGLDPASFAPSVLTGLIILGFLTALFIAFCGNMKNRRVREVFIGGEAFDREVHTFSGTEFYKTVSDLPAVGPALQSGEKGHTDIYEIGGRIGAPIIAGLRRLHTGMLTDYLFWCVIGFALLAAVLLWS